jgi:hypothetical protein
MTKAEHEIIEKWLKERAEATLGSIKEFNDLTFSDVVMIGNLYQKLQAFHSVMSDLGIQTTFNGLQEAEENNE